MVALKTLCLGGKKDLKRVRQQVYDSSWSPAQHKLISNSNISSQFELYNFPVFTRVPYSLTQICGTKYFSVKEYNI